MLSTGETWFQPPDLTYLLLEDNRNPNVRHEPALHNQKYTREKTMTVGLIELSGNAGYVKPSGGMSDICHVTVCDRRGWS